LLFNDGRLAGELRQMVGRFNSVRRESALDVTVGGDRFIAAVVRMQLVNVLADQISLDAVAGQEGEGLFQDVQFSECAINSPR